MPYPYFAAQTLDDLLREVVDELFAKGEQLSATKGGTVELRGVLLELSNPRSRISRTETRGQPFSCLGELCWYLARTNRADFITYYIPMYKKYADGDVIFGGYGPRLFAWRRHSLLSWKGIDQIANVTATLKRKPTSRQAVIQLFDATDIVDHHNDIPCTCTLQLMIRGGELHMVTNMRSNDVFLGLPHDVFAFTMLQEMIARSLSVELGTYKHAIGSLHLYDKNRDAAAAFLKEGWQSTKAPMPAMPIGSPWEGVDYLRTAEKSIRTVGTSAVRGLEEAVPYWADLVRLLQVFRSWKDRNADSIRKILGDMSSDVYRPFIERKLDALAIH